MRVDVILKYLCLVKSRSIAKALCERELVLIDGKPVRPAGKVKPGELITIRFRRQTVTIELIDVPRKQLSKTAAVDYYRNVGIAPAKDDFDEDLYGPYDVE